MTAEEKFKEMAMAAKDAIEDFNDFIDEQAISWAYDQIQKLTLAQKATRLGTLEEAAQTAGFTIGTAQQAAAAIRQRMEDMP